MMKYFFSFTLLINLLLTPSLLQSMEIRQEMYKFRLAAVQEISCETFVILERPEVGLPTTSCQLPVVYFELNSSALSFTAIETILTDLKFCGITKKDNLFVVGHTCELGSKQLNKALSQRRAETVAGFLRRHGFTIAVVQGKGSQHSLTHNPVEFSRNRRVEITLVRAKQDNF
jgi:outer membrane protein OmpA-like peptidoglycan-associated protein